MSHFQVRLLFWLIISLASSGEVSLLSASGWSCGKELWWKEKQYLRKKGILVFVVPFFFFSLISLPFCRFISFRSVLTSFYFRSFGVFGSSVPGEFSSTSFCWFMYHMVIRLYYLPSYFLAYYWGEVAIKNFGEKEKQYLRKKGILIFVVPFFFFNFFAVLLIQF